MAHVEKHITFHLKFHIEKKVKITQKEINMNARAHPQVISNWYIPR
jgi:hypothetical protein